MLTTHARQSRSLKFPWLGYDASCGVSVRGEEEERREGPPSSIFIAL